VWKNEPSAFLSDKRIDLLANSTFSGESRNAHARGAPRAETPSGGRLGMIDASFSRLHAGVVNDDVQVWVYRLSTTHGEQHASKTIFD
jgi:hypothetical protein